MKKATLKVISIIMVVMMLFATVPFAVSAEGTTVCGKSANVGDIVDVEFKLTTPSLVVNAQFNVTYDATKLELIKTTDSETFPVLTQNCITNYTDGKIYVTATNASVNDSELYNFTSGANLCVLSFRVIAEGSTDVTLTPEVIGGKNSAGISQNEVDYAVNNALANGATMAKNVTVTTPEVVDKPITVKSGDTVKITWNLTAPNYIVNSQFNVKYDSTALELVSTDNAKNFPVLNGETLQVNYLTGEICTVASVVSQDDADLYNFKNGATLCTLTFKALKDTTTTVELITEFLGGKNSDGISADEVEYAVGGGVQNGATLTRNVEFNVVTIVYGDVNGDGKVDSIDATLVLQHYANINQLSEDAQTAADVNQDGKADSIDATLILQKYAGLISAFQ